MNRYLVFARKAYAQPLTQQGVLEAAGPEQAKARALQRFCTDWVELTLISEADIHPVLSEPVSRERTAEAVVGNG